MLDRRMVRTKARILDESVSDIHARVLPGSVIADEAVNPIHESLKVSVIPAAQKRSLNEALRDSGCRMVSDRFRPAGAGSTACRLPKENGAAHPLEPGPAHVEMMRYNPRKGVIPYMQAELLGQKSESWRSNSREL